MADYITWSCTWSHSVYNQHQGGVMLYLSEHLRNSLMDLYKRLGINGPLCFVSGPYLTSLYKYFSRQEVSQVIISDSVAAVFSRLNVKRKFSICEINCRIGLKHFFYFFIAMNPIQSAAQTRL
ncbi:hypothetical protein ILYODFUR_014337 [Ilyodon furcidens]|uniref:Uncharacterized protein n=1 Tax=Ilyodon furcidens TaxID=33524 RepID=A0ABV0TW67_9TELE